MSVLTVVSDQSGTLTLTVATATVTLSTAVNTNQAIILGNTSGGGAQPTDSLVRWYFSSIDGSGFSSEITFSRDGAEIGVGPR